VAGGHEVRHIVDGHGLLNNFMATNFIYIYIDIDSSDPLSSIKPSKYEKNILNVREKQNNKLIYLTNCIYKYIFRTFCPHNLPCFMTFSQIQLFTPRTIMHYAFKICFIFVHY